MNCRLRSVVVLIALLSVLAPATGGEPLLNLEESVQKLTTESFQLRLDLLKVMPNKTILSTSLTRDEGTFYEKGLGQSPRYNHAQHAVDPSGLKVDGNRVHGPLHVTVKADRWVPADGKPWKFSIDIDAKIDRSTDDWSLTGTWKGAIRGEQRSGALTGAFDLARRNNHWNRGRWRNGGIALNLDLGKQRVNWNHARSAICAFNPARDLSGYRGLKVSIATDQPRNDAEAAVWLKEADGSWYYIKNAVPLVDKTNSAVLPFEGFDVAEWVAPGNHMDEDYQLDTSSIGGIAVGVVNPLGVGEVRFRITGIEVVEKTDATPKPASVEVTGKLLSVNDHDVVPAGLFGGYAGDLPQRYRPGCQRNLYPHTYPRIPLQRWASFGKDDFSDWVEVLGTLRGKNEARKALGAHLMEQMPDNRETKRLKEFNTKKYFERIKKWRKSGKRNVDPARAPNQLRNAVNNLLRRRDLYDAKLWKDVKLSDNLAAMLEKRRELNETELMELNRGLLAAALDGAEPISEPKPTEMFYIDCYGERKQPATMFWGGTDWRNRMTGWGRAFAENARDAGCNGTDGVGVVFEFWNEPYLHWGSKDRINLHTRYYRTDLAEEGGPVMIKRKDAEGNLVKGEIIPHFKWVRGDDPKGKREAHKGLYVMDTTAFTFWAGSGNGWIYDQMLGVIGKTIKETNPNVEVIAGWGFRWQEDHWAAWNLLYKNTIDRNIDWIDGLHEHHYQGQTTGMQAAYEVAVAYGVTAHDKWLYCWNTETNDLIDSPARGAVDTPEKARASKNYRRAIYNLRDILYGIQETPDKARGRTMIHWSQTRQGSDVCFGLMKNLRGRLVQVIRDDDDLWAVASVDGTDPEALPPGVTKVEPRELVVVLFNDNPHPREVELNVAPPTGTQWRGGYQIMKTELDPETLQISLSQEWTKEDVTPDGATAERTLKVKLDAHQGWKLTIPLRGELPEAPDVTRKQYFSPDILQTVRRDKPFETSVKLPAEAIRTAARARLRLVVEDVGVGEGVVTVCGKQVELPAAFTPDNVPAIVEVPLEPGMLKPRSTLTFSTPEGNYAGYRVDMTSIVLIAE